MPPQRKRSPAGKAAAKQRAKKTERRPRNPRGSPGPLPRPSIRRRLELLLASGSSYVGALIVAALAVGVWFVASESVTKGGTPCGGLFVPTEQPVLPEGEAPVKLASAGDPEVISFGKDRDTRRRTATLKAEGDERPPAGAQLKVLPGEFIRSQGGQIPEDQISAKATVRDDRSAVDVVLCLNPDGVDAGRYVGSVAIDDPRISAPSITYTATLQYPRQRLVGALGLLACVAALAYIWLGEGRSRLNVWLKGGITGIAAGLVAAGVAWNSAYTVAWGTGLGDVFKLVGGVFTAFTTAFLVPKVFTRKQK